MNRTLKDKKRQNEYAELLKATCLIALPSMILFILSLRVASVTDLLFLWYVSAVLGLFAIMSLVCAFCLSLFLIADSWVHDKD